MEEVLDAAEPARPRPDPLDETGCIGVDAPFGVDRTGDRIQQPDRDRRVGRRVGSMELGCGVYIRSGGHVDVRGHERVAPRPPSFNLNNG